MHGISFYVNIDALTHFIKNIDVITGVSECSAYFFNFSNFVDKSINIIFFIFSIVIQSVYLK